MYELVSIEELTEGWWIWRIRNPEGHVIEMRKWMRVRGLAPARKLAMEWCGERNRSLGKDRRELGDGKARYEANKEQMGRRHRAYLESRGLLKGQG